MKKIFSIIAVLFCLHLQAQPPRNVPVNPDSIKLGYLSNGVVVYSTIGELTRTKTPLSKHSTDSAAFKALINTNTSNIATNTSTIAAKAADNLVVHLAGTETITGYKTFNDSTRLNNRTQSVFLSLDSAGTRTFEARQVLTGSNNIFFGLNAGKAASYGVYNSGTYGLIGTNSSNTIFGSNAGTLLATGNENTIIGSKAGTNLNAAGGDPNFIGALNTLVGSLAGNSMTTGFNNTFVGQKSGTATTTGGGNTFVGKAAGEANTTNSNNTMIGASAGKFSTGATNTFLGVSAGVNATGSNNVFINGGTGSSNAVSNAVVIGVSSGGALTSAAETVLIGTGAGNVLTSGNSSTMVGYRAGVATSTGSWNTFFGDQAGSANTLGSANIFIGADAGNTNTTGSNQFVAGSAGSGGQEAINDVYFGKGIIAATPTAYTIHGTGGSGADVVGGDVQIAGGKSTGTGAAGKVTFQIAQPAGSTSSTLNSLTTVGQYDANTTAGETRFLLYDVTAGTLKRVSIGAADSGGTGYKVLRIPN